MRETIEDFERSILRFASMSCHITINFKFQILFLIERISKDEKSKTFEKKTTNCLPSTMKEMEKSDANDDDT